MRAAIPPAQRMRECRRRKRRNLALFKVELDAFLVDDKLHELGMIGDTADHDETQTALTLFLVGALQQARKKL
jgi:hypothetical protein